MVLAPTQQFSVFGLTLLAAWRPALRFFRCYRPFPFIVTFLVPLALTRPVTFVVLDRVQPQSKPISLLFNLLLRLFCLSPYFCMVFLFICFALRNVLSPFPALFTALKTFLPIFGTPFRPFPISLYVLVSQVVKSPLKHFRTPFYRLIYFFPKIFGALVFPVRFYVI